jgi:hypothetical protein
MAHMMPLEGALKNLKQEVPPARRREYVPRERALELLKQWTGQDFGFDVHKWEAWIAEHGSKLVGQSNQSRKAEETASRRNRKGDRTA